MNPNLGGEGGVESKRKLTNGFSYPENYKRDGFVKKTQ